MEFRNSKYMTAMSSRKNAMKSLSVAVLVGIASLGATNSAQAQDTTTITTTLSDGTEQTVTLQTTYGDSENADSSVTTEVTVLDQPVTYTYNYDSTTTSSRQISFNGQDINGNFIGNYITSSNNSAYGGAIYNTGIIGDITGGFIENSVTAYSGCNTADFIVGGAIYNTGIIGDITGNFISNYAKSSSSQASYNPAASGGAIFNKGTIGNITGDFVDNHANSYLHYTRGGAIYNTGTIGDITGNFIGNSAVSGNSYSPNVHGGAIYNSSTGTIGNISGNFINNSAISSGGEAHGGAIYNTYNTGSLTITNSSFINNHTYSSVGDALGGAIWTSSDLSLIAKDGFTSIISGNYVEDYNSRRSEAIRLVNHTPASTYVGREYINGTTASEYIRKNELPILTTLSFINNANSKTIIEDQIIGEKTEFIDEMYYEVWNSSKGEYEKQYVELNADGTYHDIETPESIYFTPKLNITGDGTGLVQLNNDVINMDITLDNSTLHLGARDNVLDNNNLTLNSSTLSMINNQAGESALNSLTVTGDTNVLVDVDLASQTMDRFSAKSYGEHQGNLNVTGMNLLSDAVDDTTRILFAENGLKDNVTTTVTEVAYTPIYKYSVSYDKSGEDGYFVFDRFSTANSGSSGGASNPSESFNPAVLGSSSSATVGALGTMNQTMNNVFQHSDNYMHIPYLERVSMRDRNKYALSLTGDSTGMGRYSPLYQRAEETTSVWVKPYATFETVGLKNGPKVHNNAYGTLIGFDTGLQPIKRGWDRVFTGYIGYNGASQRYSGIDSTQNGGLIGGTVTMYKGNFFNATTVSVGANVAQNQTMYGSEDFAMLLSGIGNKTGYNFEFKEGKLILQPSMLMSYTFVNTFDYTNAAGVRIDNKPLHALQLAPGVKVIGNLKGGWQPYASVQMVWNLMGESNATANGVKLPEMSIKPYVQYGIGVQKRIKDHFTAYGQAMVQNGGRNGISLTAGFRWALGHDNCKYKVDAKQLRGKAAKSKCHSELDSESINANKTLSPTLSQGEGATGSKKILKQMTPQQRAAHGGKYASTTRSAKAGMLRQL